MRSYGINSAKAAWNPYADMTAGGIAERSGFAEKMQEAEKKETERAEKTGRRQEKRESETDTEIIVKPDGSRVLMINVNIGEMKTMMSMEISKPTAMANDISDISEQGDITVHGQCQLSQHTTDACVGVRI